MKPFNHLIIGVTLVCFPSLVAADHGKPNIVLVMADDQGWGQTSYNGHPVLKTPNLDAMAANGIRFDRFYAAGPVCSPTRASVLTGRTHHRTGVPSHGHNLCLQEKTLPNALKHAGYATGHFGKWHLNGIRGPGVPVLGDDANHPGRYGFDEWLTVTNYFDLNPLMSRKGVFEEFEGDSSNIVVGEALKFITEQAQKKTPSLTVIWYGSPHSPMRALEEDMSSLPEAKYRDHLGEIVGIDRSVGALRKGLRDLGIERDTLFWYCSDNGGLKNDPAAVKNLRGHKGSVYEGGIRVPGIIEWPGKVQPAVVEDSATTMDIMPTLVDLLELPAGCLLSVHDGESLMPVLNGGRMDRQRPIPFYFQKQRALIDGDFKVLTTGKGSPRKQSWELYDLKNDPGESNNLASDRPELFRKLKTKAEAAIASIEASAEGKDYPEGKVVQPPRNEFWTAMKAYQPHFERFFKRPEYESWAKKVPKELRP